MHGPLYVATKLLGHMPNHVLPPLNPTKPYNTIRDMTRCKDGTTLSLQASEHHYCEPRDNAGPWTHVEVHLVSVPVPESWHPYGEDDEGRKGPYANIPAELVAAFIDEHGGLA